MCLFRRYIRFGQFQNQLVAYPAVVLMFTNANAKFKFRNDPKTWKCPVSSQTLPQKFLNIGNGAAYEDSIDNSEHK